jgi:hypothetical protein
MSRFSLDVFQRLEELTGGGSCGFWRTGYLLGVDERMRKPMETSVALQRASPGGNRGPGRSRGWQPHDRREHEPGRDPRATGGQRCGPRRE